MMDLVCILMGSLGTGTVQRNKWCGKVEWLIERENWFGCYGYLNASIEDIFYTLIVHSITMLIS